MKRKERIEERERNGDMNENEKETKECGRENIEGKVKEQWTEKKDSIRRMEKCEKKHEKETMRGRI